MAAKIAKTTFFNVLFCMKCIFLNMFLLVYLEVIIDGGTGSALNRWYVITALNTVD